MIAETYLEAVASGVVLESVLLKKKEDEDKITKKFFEKYSDKPGIFVKKRHVEEEMVVISKQCEGGNCPVVVAPKSEVEAKKKATKKKSTKKA